MKENVLTMMEMYTPFDLKSLRESLLGSSASRCGQRFTMLVILIVQQPIFNLVVTKVRGRYNAQSGRLVWEEFEALSGAEYIEVRFLSIFTKHTPSSLQKKK
jgi:hypothetical protein